jgi:hypothetical protein
MHEKIDFSIVGISSFPDDFVQSLDGKKQLTVLARKSVEVSGGTPMDSESDT